MPNDHATVLSDIHIGNDASTCWYQTGAHEPYLVATLDWVVHNAGRFQEVILLGDLVDTWTYPPSVKPPSIADIITANPNVLGPNGALANGRRRWHPLTCSKWPVSLGLSDVVARTEAAELMHGRRCVSRSVRARRSWWRLAELLSGDGAMREAERAAGQDQIERLYAAPVGRRQAIFEASGALAAAGAVDGGSR